MRIHKRGRIMTERQVAELIRKEKDGTITRKEMKRLQKSLDQGQSRRGYSAKIRHKEKEEA